YNFRELRSELVARGSRLRSMSDTECRDDLPGDADRDSVRYHLIADVPIGIFLSAGIDSGALLGLIAEARGGFAEGVGAVTVTYPEYRGTASDEAPLAAQLAQDFGAQ